MKSGDMIQINTRDSFNSDVDNYEGVYSCYYNGEIGIVVRKSGTTDICVTFSRDKNAYVVLKSECTLIEVDNERG